eukprot:1159087-Pelagomonas_calceolata.AAC.6
MQAHVGLGEQGGRGVALGKFLGQIILCVGVCVSMIKEFQRPKQCRWMLGLGNREADVLPDASLAKSSCAWECV